jgi:phage host-nuclease inhibitor protein Gam
MNVNEIIATAERLGPSEPLHPLASYEDEEKGIGWSVKDKSDAEFALRCIAEADADIADVRAAAEAARAQIAAREASLVAKAERRADFMRWQIARYAEANRSSLLRGKRKTAEFLHGALKWRSKPERLEVVDKDALAAWLATQPPERCLYRIEFKPEMRALQELLRTTGEVPPGTEAKPAEETLTVEAVAPERALKE